MNEEKRKPYWLIGGFSGLIAGIIGYLVMFYYYRVYYAPQFEGIVTLIDTTYRTSWPSIAYIFIYIAVFFAAGALIGWIIQYYKENKE
jgi:hypothetical protein